jgi:hypothetical protein
MTRTVHLVADQASLPPADRADGVTAEPFDLATLDNLVGLAFPPEAMESVAEWAASAPVKEGILMDQHAVTERQSPDDRKTA